MIRVGDNYAVQQQQQQQHTPLWRGDNWKRRAGKLVNKNVSPFGCCGQKEKLTLPPAEVQCASEGGGGGKTFPT